MEPESLRSLYSVWSLNPCGTCMSGCKIHQNRLAGRSNCPDPQTTFILPPKPFSILSVSLGSATWLYGLRGTVQPAVRSSGICTPVSAVRRNTVQRTARSFGNCTPAAVRRKPFNPQYVLPGSARPLAVKRNTVQQTVRSSRTCMPALRLVT